MEKTKHDSPKNAKGGRNIFVSAVQAYIYTSLVCSGITESQSYRTWIPLLWPSSIDCDLTFVCPLEIIPSSLVCLHPFISKDLRIRPFLY